MNLAVIPARGGSKRIPRKNIKTFGGKPMIAWSIEAALESNCFEKVVVSTDDNEIARVAKAYGAEVPFFRPEELSDDYTGTSPVVRHAIDEMAKQGAKFENVCCIYATAPFMTSEFIQQGLESLKRTGAPYVFSVCSYPYPIQRAVKVSENRTVSKFKERDFNVRSQDLEEAFHDAGQLYWGTTEAWMSKQSVFAGNSQALVLPRHRVQDIDTLEDWQRAELMMKALQLETS